MPYAEHTTVSAEKSRAEIESTLARYGADSFGYMTDPTSSIVIFRCKNRMIKIVVPKPNGSQLERKRGQPWNYPTDNQREAWVDQENRRRWRALLIVIKSKLEAVHSGIATFEDEFLPYTVMPNGQTVAEWARPQLDEMGAGRMPRLLMSAEPAQEVIG